MDIPLKILEITETKKKEEYVVIKVTQDTNLSRYVLVDFSFDQAGNVSNKQRHVFRFPSVNVEKNSYLLVYTSKPIKGIPNEGVTADGKVFIRLYWGLDHNVWNDTGDVARIFETTLISEFQYKKKEE